jgi:hypothetical protein
MFEFELVMGRKVMRCERPARQRPRGLRAAIDQASQDRVTASFFAMFANYQRHGWFPRKQPQRFRLVQLPGDLTASNAFIKTCAEAHRARPVGLHHLIMLGALWPRVQEDVGSIVATKVMDEDVNRPAMLRDSLWSCEGRLRRVQCEMSTIPRDTLLPAGTWLLFEPRD